jgi:DNA-binding NtrC family response regulator
MRVLSEPDFLHQNLIGSAPQFLESVARIRKFAACDATVLIEGETGTGKELAARAIHYLGARHASPFVAVNCGAIPDSLIESEFFGHVRGAFTDAKYSRDGVVEQARAGTLFLDELEALSPRGQVVLLRFLQDQIYTPVGAGACRKANVRIIGATNADLRALASRNSYRMDLVYRLCVLAVALPPLRERPGDAQLLARRFTERFSKQYGRPSRPLSSIALRCLENYSWAGNVRELENLIHREVILSDEPEITLSEIHSVVADRTPPAPEPAFHRFRVAKARVISEFERNYIADLLARTRGNISLAARLAGKDRSRFGKLLKKHGFARAAFARRAG